MLRGRGAETGTLQEKHLCDGVGLHAQLAPASPHEENTSPQAGRVSRGRAPCAGRVRKPSSAAAAARPRIHADGSRSLLPSTRDRPPVVAAGRVVDRGTRAFVHPVLAGQPGPRHGAGVERLDLGRRQRATPGLHQPDPASARR